MFLSCILPPSPEAVPRPRIRPQLTQLPLVRLLSTNLEHHPCNGTDFQGPHVHTPFQGQTKYANDLEPSNITTSEPERARRVFLPIPRIPPLLKCRFNRAPNPSFQPQDLTRGHHPLKAPRVTRPSTESRQTCLRHTRTILRYPNHARTGTTFLGTIAGVVLKEGKQGRGAEGEGVPRGRIGACGRKIKVRDWGCGCYSGTGSVMTVRWEHDGSGYMYIK